MPSTRSPAGSRVDSGAWPWTFGGRGESGWAPGTYTIPQYVFDVLALLDALAIETAHVLGTSLGGLVGLSLAAARVAAYAAAAPDAFPDLAAAEAWALEQYPCWPDCRPNPRATPFAGRSGARRSGDRPGAAADAGRGSRREPAWWSALESLECPLVLVRGAESHILAAETAARMVAPGSGRRVRGRPPPALTEPAVVAALDAFYLGASSTRPAPR